MADEPQSNDAQNAGQTPGQTPPDPAAASTPVSTPPPNAPVNDDEYEDVLYAALSKVYDSLEGGGQVDGPPAGDGITQPAQKSPDDMTLEELKAALAKTNETLKTVVQVTLADREEKNAVSVWNAFLDQASETEKSIAKTLTFEVEDKEGMDKQIAQVKATAKAVDDIIQKQVGNLSTQQKATLKSQYGILSPEPETDVDVKVQDKEDLDKGNFSAVIARRFARRSRA